MIKIDKKKLILLILTVFWLFMFKGMEKKEEYRPPKRLSKKNNEEIPPINYGGLISRKEVKLQMGGNIFEGASLPPVDTYSEEIDEEELIKDEMNRIIFMGYLSEGEYALFLEYDGEFYEILNGGEIEIEVQERSFKVDINLDEENILTLFEPENKITIKREI